MLDDIEQITKHYITPKNAASAGYMGVEYSAKNTIDMGLYLCHLMFNNHLRMFKHKFIYPCPQGILMAIFILANKMDNIRIQLFLVKSLDLHTAKTVVNLEQPESSKQALLKRIKYLEKKLINLS